MPETSAKPLIKLSPVTVISNTEIAPAVFLLSFCREFEFKAGQVLGLGLSATDDARLYSIASGEADENIGILYNIKPGGKLTPDLASLKAGDTLWVSAPFGSYLGDSQPAYWIAAGTGIAPFYSMFRSGLGGNKFLVHGGRSLPSFYFQDEFKTTLGGRYVRACSQQQAEGVYHGRVTDYLRQAENLNLNLKFYLCGSAEMVIECREILLAKGVSYHNIVAEIYF